MSSEQSKAQDVTVDAYITLIQDGSVTKPHVVVKINTPQGVERTPSDICCVIDVSGSMHNPAYVKNADGTSESHGFSLLDIVKHAVGTIIATLGPNDRLCLISFSDKAVVNLPLTEMNDAGKLEAKDKLSAMTANGSTDFWAGLEKGLEAMKNTGHGRLSSLLILTDGESNHGVDRGAIAPTMKVYKDQHGLPCAVNTFGFGYNVESNLLKRVSAVGSGMYSFIPDSSLVGTVFVNTISNLLSSFAKNVTITVEPAVKVDRVRGNLQSFEKPKKGASAANLLPNVFDIGYLQYSQTRDIFVSLHGEENAKVTLKYQQWNQEMPTELTVQAVKAQKQTSDLEFQISRILLVEALVEVVDKCVDLHSRQTCVQNLINALEAYEKNEGVQKLLEDASGQVREGVSVADFWDRWGRHFIPSLAGAHFFQQCNNFKDPGIQGYGGELFQKLRESVGDIFKDLAPPPCSLQPGKVEPVAMNTYYNVHGGCFDGNCTVSMSTGSEKFVKDLKKGDKVKTSGGNAEIMCVVKMNNVSSTASLCQINGLRITAYHPIRVEGVWKFPRNVTEPQAFSCDAVYSFVLDSEHVMLINGTECVTLGHNFQEDVVRHDYFGSSKVVDDLKSMSGWEKGLIEFPNMAECFERDSVTNEVKGFRQSRVMCPGA